MPRWNVRKGQTKKKREKKYEKKKATSPLTKARGLQLPICFLSVFLQFHNNSPRGILTSLVLERQLCPCCLLFIGPRSICLWG